MGQKIQMIVELDTESRGCTVQGPLDDQMLMGTMILAALKVHLKRSFEKETQKIIAPSGNEVAAIAGHIGGEQKQ